MATRRHRLASAALAALHAIVGLVRRWPIELSRHGALAAERTVQAAAERTAQAAERVADSSTARTARTATRRAMALVLGSTFIGSAVGLLVHARLGLTPYDVLLSAVRNNLGISLGQAAWMMSGVLFAVAAALGQRPRLTSLLFVFMNGVAVDIAIGLIRDPDSLAIRIGFAAFAILLLASGVSLVLHSGLTGGSFELLMNAGAARSIDPIRVRTGLEVGLFGLGLVLGGDFGVVTVVYAAVIGTAIRLTRQALIDHRRGRQERLLATKDDQPVPAGLR